MNKRQVGINGRAVNPMGLGCMSFGGMYGPADDAESLTTLARALEVGVDFWDTANVYGNGHSEKIIGRFFAEDRARRDKVYLATKFSIRRNAQGQRTFDNSVEHMHESLDASLKRLGLDYVDLYYVHRLDERIPIEDTVGALSRLVEAGKIRAIGLSEMAPDTLRRAHAVHPITAMQSEYSLWTRTPELGVLQTCKELGVAFVAFSTIGRGYFGGNLSESSVFAEGDFRNGNPRFEGINWTRNLQRLEPFKALAARWGTTPATLANAWVLAKDDHILTIPGTRYARHLEQNNAANDLALTPAQVAEVEAVLPLGFAAGSRYSKANWLGVESYC